MDMCTRAQACTYTYAYIYIYIYIDVYTKVYIQTYVFCIYKYIRIRENPQRLSKVFTASSVMESSTELGFVVDLRLGLHEPQSWSRMPYTIMNTIQEFT